MLRFRPAVLLGVSGIVALAPVVAQEPLSLNERGMYRAEFQPLGDLPGDAYFSEATAVSGDGSTVVGYSRSNSINANGSDEAFRWRDGQMLALGAPPLYSSAAHLRFSRATGVNYDGTIIAGTSTGWLEPYRSSLLWLDGTLSSSNVFIESEGGRMANNNAWTGRTEFFQFYPNAFLRSPNPGQSAVICYPSSCGDGSTRSNDISADGTTIVGSATPYPFLTSNSHAFRWRVGTGYQALGTLPGFTSCTSTAVSGDGSTVHGYCWIIGSSQPFRWTSGTGMVPSNIPFPPTAVSYDGSIAVAGGSIWDAVNGTRSLKTLLTGYGIDMSAWSFLIINDVSDDGMVFVGYGSRTNGNYEAFRAVLPEPATALLLAPMAMLLRTQRRQRHAQ